MLCLLHTGYIMVSDGLGSGQTQGEHIYTFLKFESICSQNSLTGHWIISTFLNWNPILGLIKQEFFGSKSNGTSGVNTSTDSASRQSRESGKLHPKAYCGTPPFGEAGPEPEHPTFTTEVTSPTCDNLGKTSATISTRAQHFSTTFPISCCSKWATQLYGASWSC